MPPCLAFLFRAIDRYSGRAEEKAAAGGPGPQSTCGQETGRRKPLF